LICAPFIKTEVTSLSLVHLICTLAIGVSLSISVEIKEAKGITYSCLYYFLIAYMAISIVWMLGAIFWGNSAGCCLARGQHEAHIPGYLIIGVTFLCIGSSFISAVEFLSFAFSTGCKGITHDVEKKLVSEAIYDLTKFFFLILQLYFFCRFSSKFFFDTSCMRIFLMHIIGVNLCTWFYILVDESVVHDPPADHLLSNCSSFKNMESFRKTINGYFYPFSIEYSVMSSVLLFLMWYRLKSRDNEPLAEISEYTCWQRFKTAFFDKCCREGRPVGEQRPISFWRSAICGYVFGVVVLVFILVLMVILGIEFKPDNKYAVFVYYGSRICVYWLMSFVCLFGLKYLSQHPPEDIRQTAHTIVDAALIMIGVSGCYLLVGFQVTAASSDLGNCTSYYSATPNKRLNCHVLKVSIVDSVSALFQFTLQAFFIVRALKRCAPLVRPSTSGSISSALVVRRCSAFLSIANIGIWAMYTFELKDSAIETIENSAYSNNKWLILSHVAYPLCIFFRLHSVFCCFEIVINRFGVVLPDTKPPYQPLSSDEESPAIVEDSGLNEA
jgi:hypothetical protein